MKTMSRTAAAVASFAQLLGLSKAAEEEEGKKSKRAEEEDEQARAEEECEEEDEEKDKDGKKSKRAEEEDGGSDDGDMHAEEEDNDDGDEKEKGKGRKAKSKGKAAEEEDDDEDGDEKSARSAIRRNRARVAQIIAHGQATGRIHQATVAAQHGLSVKVAKAILDAGEFDQSADGKPRSSLAERMATTGVPNVGADGGDKPSPGMTKVAAAIIAVGEKLEKSRAAR